MALTSLGVGERDDGIPRVTITSIELRNYKAFHRYSLRVQALNVLVGPNNAGKSTLLGVFRALEVALRRARSRKPDVVEGPKGGTWGYTLSSESLPISIENVHTDYADTDTTVTFRLSNGNKLHLFFPDDGGCILIPEAEKKWARTVTAFKEQFPLSVVVVPVLGPVEHQEELFQIETVQRNLSTHRASRHFRNYWYHFPDGFDEFADMVRTTWPGMDIQFPELAGGMSRELVMFCLEHRMTRELFWSGFGFQVWCQLLTHLYRAKDATLFVIDEPDIYLHPDLQRNFLGMLRGVAADVVLATHSTEIIGEADPSEIVVVDKKKQSAQRLRDVEQVQAVLTDVGSIQNITLTRLANNQTLIFTEGDDDFSVLRSFARQLNLVDLAAGLNLTPVESGGFSSWERIKALGWGMEKTLGKPLRIGVVYDRDFACSEEIDAIVNELGKHVPFVHVHARKEIENYLLIPDVLLKAVKVAIRDRERRTAERIDAPGTIDDLLDDVTTPLKTRVQGQYVARRTEYLRRIKADSAIVAQETLDWFEDKWRSIETRMEIVPGKEVLAQVRFRLQSRFGISLTNHRIISECSQKEVPQDLRNLLGQLDQFRSPPGSDEVIAT